MDMPQVEKFFGVFPPKHGTWLISVFGLSSGGLGIAGIILFALIEKAIMIFVYGGGNDKLDDTVKKVVLITIGLTSLLLCVANVLLFLGATANSRGSLASGVFIILVMCIILIFEAILLPLSCFFHQKSCVIKKFSTTLVAIGGIIIGIFLELWLYFMIVANTYLEQI